MDYSDAKKGKIQNAGSSSARCMFLSTQEGGWSNLALPSLVRGKRGDKGNGHGE